ncbi:hypothetical protein CXG43_18495 [Stenotrophomonas sp. Bg11-02]|nr:hypothetical protein CXG43_18495 [Stenotrophomonas sp. Bg11-02]
MVGERSGLLAGRFRRPWVGATAGSMAAMDLSKVGRGGLAGALSAMDGAKRGPQDAVVAVAKPPCPANKQPCSF